MKERNVLFNDAHNTFMVIWHRTYGIIQIAREKAHCCHYMGYFFHLAARDLLYAPSHRQDSTYHSRCYTSRGALAGTRNSSIAPRCGINPTTYRTMSYISLPCINSSLWVLLFFNVQVLLTLVICTKWLSESYILL